MTKIKYIPDKQTLQALNNDAIRRGYNRHINPNAFNKIRPARYPITFSYLHDDSTIRCQIILNENPDTVLLDMGIDVFNALPEAEKKEG